MAIVEIIILIVVVIAIFKTFFAAKTVAIELVRHTAEDLESGKSAESHKAAVDEAASAIGFVGAGLFFVVIFLIFAAAVGEL